MNVHEKVLSFVFLLLACFQHSSAQQLTFKNRETGKIKEYSLPQRAEVKLADGTIFMQTFFTRKVNIDSIARGMLFVHRNYRFDSIALDAIAAINLRRDFFTTVVTLWAATACAMFAAGGLVILYFYAFGPRVVAGPSPALAAGMLVGGGLISYLGYRYNVRHFALHKWEVVH